ncbi:glycoside hydrolase family 104 protein [Pendulispora albinea]|uniref:Glycoside hydrolase family 104 protein n=1 Tax=Pendulispora albinea TaxID=2741071 RepID=A0ABZ2MBU4_9BACT
MRTILRAMGVLLLAVPVFACSSKPGESTQSPGRTEADIITVKASDTTRSTLGVASWGIHIDESSATVIHGYDGSRASIIEFQQSIVRGSRDTFEATLRTKGSSARMKLEKGADPSQARMVENTFANDAEAHRVLARIIADVENQPATRAGTGLLDKAGEVHAADLVSDGSTLYQPGKCLTKTCNASLVGSASAGAHAVTDCDSSGANSTNCSGSLQNAQRTSNQSTFACTTSEQNRGPANAPAAPSCSPDLAKDAVPAMHRAMLDTIAYTEGTAGSCGTDGYSTGVGYHCIESCASHPNTLWGNSTAAGRYQFLNKTWAGLGKSDFGPANQDIAAIELIKRRGVDLPTDRALSDSEFEDAMRKLSPEWASLPYATYGQPTKSLTETRARYCAAAGCDC